MAGDAAATVDPITGEGLYYALRSGDLLAEAIADGAIEDTSQAAEVIIAESRRLERLVGDLLDLTKLEARQMSISIRPTDVAEVVGTTAEGFRPAADSSGVRLVVHLPGERAFAVMADPDRLAQALRNLIDNALAHTTTTTLLHGKFSLEFVAIKTILFLVFLPFTVIFLLDLKFIE